MDDGALWRMGVLCNSTELGDLEVELTSPRAPCDTSSARKQISELGQPRGNQSPKQKLNKFSRYRRNYLHRLTLNQTVPHQSSRASGKDADGCGNTACNEGLTFGHGQP